MSNSSVVLNVKDVYASGARVTHFGLNEMEVCAPSSWGAAAVAQFATSKMNCMIGHRWQVGPQSNECTFEAGFAHFQLHAVKHGTPMLELVHEHSEFPRQLNRSVHVSAIINFATALEAGELDDTAESFEILAQWLRVKARAVEARAAQDATLAAQYEAEAETSNNRVLAHFRGTLVIT